MFIILNVYHTKCLLYPRDGRLIKNLNIRQSMWGYEIFETYSIYFIN